MGFGIAIRLEAAITLEAIAFWKENKKVWVRGSFVRVSGLNGLRPEAIHASGLNIREAVCQIKTVGQRS